MNFHSAGLVSLMILTASPAAGAEGTQPGQAAPAAAPQASIQWMEWSDEAFARATAEGKPILLNVRALWSRASLWSEEVNFADPEVVKLANEKWIPIRVDRDRRPDLDMRYQVAVNAAFPGEAGWPMTALLYDSGDIMFGSSSISLKDRRDKVGLRSLLAKTSELYAAYREKAEGTRRIVNMAFQREMTAGRPAEYNLEYLEGITKDMVTEVDPDHGGFGDASRVPMLYTLELAGTVYQRVPRAELLDVLVKSLRGMQKGALFDRVGGGFHRGAMDAAWRNPEFEKLLSYNSALLVDYLLGYEIAAEPEFKETAESTLDFILGTLKDPQGGFFLGQWAAPKSDEPRGTYYSWTNEEFTKALPPGGERLARLLYNVTPEGDLALGPPSRSLLYLAMTRKEASEKLGESVEAVRQGDREILAALARSRSARTAPPVERAIYVDSCSSAVIAMFEAWRVLGRNDALEAGKAALDRLLAAIPANGPMLHRVMPPPERGVDPTLALDHMMLARAALAGFEATEEPRYLAAARDLVDRADRLFWDSEGTGYFDIVADPNARGYLSIRRRPPNDTAYPALNSLAARVLARLTHLTGEAAYRERGDICLKQLVAHSKDLTYRMGGLGLALDAYLRAPTQYIVVGRQGDEKADQLRLAALRLLDPGKVVQRLVPGRDDEALDRMKLKKSKNAYAVVCRAGKCSEPAKDDAALKERASPARNPKDGK